MPSVVLGGSIASPAHRFAAVVERHAATVLKAGSTFIRMFITQPGAVRLLVDFDLSTLRLGVFCAEPVNEIVHAFACRHVAPSYINCYWASEHGGIVWSRCHGNVDQMEIVRQVEPLSMGWCLECHRDPSAHIRPLDVSVTKMDWNPTDASIAAAKELLVGDNPALNPPIHCSACHR